MFLGSVRALLADERREAGPPNHHDDKVDSDQEVVKGESRARTAAPPCPSPPPSAWNRASSSLSGPVVPSLRALSGRLNFTVRRHKFNTDSLLGRADQSSAVPGVVKQPPCGIVQTLSSAPFWLADCFQVGGLRVRYRGTSLIRNARLARTSIGP